MTKGFAYQEIGNRIRELRGRERQKDWAARIGCDQGYISQVENGVTKPSLSFLKGVATISCASIDWILTGRGLKNADEYMRCASTGQQPGGVMAYNEDTLGCLTRNPKLMMGVERLLRMDPIGRGILEAFGEMDESRVAGLASFLGVDKD